MPRPWYTYVFLFVGILALLGAVFRPMMGATSADPGGLVLDGDGRLQVRPGSPLDRAGIRTGDRFRGGERIQAPAEGEERWLIWKRGIPQPGGVEVLRGEETLAREVHPAPPVWPVRLGWAVLGLLNVGLVALALALFWQRPREGPALLLGFVLLSAPVFAFPGEPRLLALVFAAHFFAIFPPPSVRPRWWQLGLRLYLPFAFFGLIGAGLWEDGKVSQAARLFDLMALGYAGYGLVKVLTGWRRAAPEEGALYRTLAAAAAAILTAVLAGISGRIWLVSDQYIPATLPQAAIFSAAVAHLVFRTRALEVRLMARRTLQYFLARWTLGTLFLIPGFLLVWRLGQLSATQESPKAGEWALGLVWMYLVALLLGKRQTVLRNLDRRFFRDIEAARVALIRLAQDPGRCTNAQSVLAALEEGVRAALHPRFVHYRLPDVPPDKETALVIPLHRGEQVVGCLHLGVKDSGEEYTSEERQLLEAAAVQAAVALENARLSAALLARQRAELTARTAGVLAGAEEERRRLAADLHDQVLPELRGIAGEVGQLRDRANGLAPDLDRLEGEIRGTMDSVREVMEALRPSALDMLGLADALESYFRKGAARCVPPVSVSVRRVGEEPRLTAEQSLALYRICQEAMNNVLKHSGARKAGLEVRCEDGLLSLVIWDDGCGVDPEACAGKGHGLANMRYRADLVGAAVDWSARAEGGTRVEVRLPLPQAARETVS